VYFVLSLCFGVVFLCSFLLQYFDTVGWVFLTCKKTSAVLAILCWCRR